VYPERTAVVDGERTFSYAELAARADALGRALRDAGVAAGQRVAVLAPNRSELIEAHFGVPASGAVLCAINIRLAGAEIAHILAHSSSKLVLCDPELRHLVPDGIRVIELGDAYEQFLAGASPAPLAAWPDQEERPISVNYTSGTTGRPKGVVYSHRGAYLVALEQVINAGLTCDSRYLWTLPLFHCNGWTYPWAVTAAGGTHVCLRRVEPGTVWRELRGGITNLCAAPTVLISLYSHADAAPLERPLRITTAGAPPSPTVIARMEALGATIVHAYGLTETYGPFTICAWPGEWDALPDDERHRRRARQGVPPTIGGGVRVLDPDGNDVPADGVTQGEIAMRGNGVMLGYLDDPEATARACAGGWFHSGDGAVMHPDGYVEIRDRLKDVIISGGENISSVEVEQVIVRHPSVLEAAVVGVPDDRWGERPKAFVTLAEGKTVDAAELIAFCRDELAHFKCPDSVEFGPLPKTSTGKVQKVVLREAEWAGRERRVN
ncbi:MAG: AMP-binding protein, partial [Gaiellales bacterium]